MEYVIDLEIHTKQAESPYFWRKRCSIVVSLTTYGPRKMFFRGWRMDG